MATRFVCFLLFVLFSLSLFSQNRDSYFKVPLQPDADMPDWAQLMYSEDPNVLEVEFLLREYFRELGFEKNIHTQNYKFWRRTISPFIDPMGYIRPLSPREEDVRVKYLKERRKKLQTDYNGSNWTSLGPVETYENGSLTPVSWHANVYCIDRSLQDPDLLFCGTEAGGVFRSSDKGQNWELLGKMEGFARGIHDIKVSPSNTTTVLMTANDRIYRSTDSGDSWEEVFFIGTVGRQLRFHPENPSTIFFAANNGLYRSDDEGDNWETILTGNCWDIQFHPTDPKILYLLRSNAALKRTDFYKSTDGGENWELKDQGWYVPADLDQAEEFGGKIAVTPSAPNLIYAGLIGDSKANDNGWIGVYRSTDAGESWVNPSGQDGGPYPGNYNPAAYNSGYHQGWFNFDVEVSDNNPAVIWVGTIRLNESADSAKTFVPIGAANSQRLDRIHADIQDIEVIGDEIWVASDGGINYSTDELYSHVSLKKGIIASEYWGFGSGWNEDVLVGGLYHNGNSTYYQTYGQGNFKRAGGVEEATGYVHPIENRKAYFSQGWAGFTAIRELPTDLAGQAVEQPGIPLLPNESYIESTSSGIYFDPRYADHLYAGSGGGFWKSTNGGASFQQLHDFGQNGRVLEIAQSRSQPDVFYCVFQPGGGYWDPCEIHRSADEGQSWTKLPDLPANRWRLEITLNPEDENEIWVAANSAANGEKVFSSSNGGQNWQNRTTSLLNGERTKDIFFQAGSGGIVYLATNTGLFQWDPDAEEWLDYSTGLPLIINALEMRPFYRDSKLRLATYSRGIWESPLAASSLPIAQPITYRDTVYCPRDTVQFDCYSVLDHAGASWSWTFEPEPQFVSSTESRNPKVVFGSAGSYAVTLAVEGGNGNVSTKTIEDMVAVVGSCEPDTIPGMALYFPGNQGDYVTTKPLDLSTNTLTISAWIKPEGIQPDYAGIVFCRGGTTTVGLNFRVNNELGYHWDDQQWWWSSGAYPEPGQWNHIALVIQPDQAILYLNGVPYEQSATHPAEAFDSPFVLGADVNWSDRRFKGEMDEVCIWNRALSQEEVRLLRHLTKEHQAMPGDPSYDPDLVAYYQFNETGGDALDRVRLAHGSVGGAVQRFPSSVPVGAGESALETISEAGYYDFESTGLTMEFPTSSSYPDGELVVSRINLLPNLLPNLNPGLQSYWIINNYGENTFFSSEPVVRVRPRVDEPNPELVSEPDFVRLHQRQANAFQNTWFEECGAEAVVESPAGYFQFGENCNFDGAGMQLFLNSAELDVPLLEGEVSSLSVPALPSPGLFPNPVAAGEAFWLQSPANEALDWYLYDSSGKRVQAQSFYGPFDEAISAPEESGIYFYQIRLADWIYNGKLVVKR
jgi:PKD repeat protein/photosystem II stability/assembly factor-like uncharacterized protein